MTTLMALLALYWSIMIACYSWPRACESTQKNSNLWTSSCRSRYALVLLMGLRMGADEEVTSSLGSIGIQALLSRC